MPKKKPLARRLDKLFEDIKHQEPGVEPQPAETPVPAPQQPPASAKSEKPAPAAQSAPSLQLSRATQYTETALALDFKLSADTWATLQILDETNQRAWTEEDELLARQVTDQLSLALENARLFQETQRSEAELRALFASMNDVIIVYDKDGYYVKIAPTNPSLLVRPPDEMVGKNIRDVLPPELHQPFMKTIHQALSKNEIARIEYPLEIKGTRFWFDANVSKLNETQVFWVARDITDRKINEITQAAISHITESALTAHSEKELFRTVHESLQPILPAENFFVALYNPAIQLITFPYHVDEYEQNDEDWAPRKLGRGLTSYVIRSGKSLRVTPEIFADLEASGEVVSDGAPSVDWLGVPLKSGGVVRGVMAVQTYDPEKRLTDKHIEILETIATQTAAALERLQAREALERRNTYLAASAEIGRLVTSTLDLNTIFTQTVNLVSDRLGFYFAAIYQTDEEGYNVILRQATGGAGEKMKSQKSRVAIGAQSAVGKAAESGEVVLVNNVATDRLYQPNPLLLDTQSEAAIPLKVSGKTLGVIDIHSTQPHAFTSDVIAVLQSLADQVAVAINNATLYLESQELIKNLQEVDKLKSQFLANMSHELRTPLNSIIGFSRVILKGIDGPITDMQQQDLTAIYNSGQHLLGLINDILDLARIEAGKMELNFEEVRLPDIIHSVLSTAKGLVKEKPIQLIEKVPADMPTVRGDTMRVRQILLNLISNAAKFTDEGFITIESSVQKAPNGKFEALIKVIDTGPGISPEGQQKLFKAFSQVDGSATRKTGGSGLGLSICANLVQLHGGRIGVESQEGKGSTFWFTMPLFRQPAEEIPADKKIVLAIDDDLQVISLYERYLTPQGYHVVALTEPARAKERAKEIRPFAITLDIMMPHVDGWAVLADLKSDPATRDIPVIICSIVEQTDKGFNLGAADYLVKPILEEDLVHALNRLNKDGTIRRVLVIDDDPNDLRLIEKILSEHGNYQAILAEGGRRGWEILNTNPPDAVILDIFMPEMDGFMILEKLQEEPALRKIPTLVISGGGLTSEQHKQLAEYGKRLIAKGALNENDLIASIENALKRISR
jgi:PAS domain S-box-containing protein